MRRGAETALALEAEQAARAKEADTAKMYAARLKEAEKDVFKLERLVQEKEKAFASYQARSRACAVAARCAACCCTAKRVIIPPLTRGRAPRSCRGSHRGQTTAERQIERLAAAMKAAGVTL